MVLPFKNICIAFSVQIWRYISGGAASSFRAAASDHPGCCGTDGATAQRHWGTMSNDVHLLLYLLTHLWCIFIVIM